MRSFFGSLNILDVAALSVGGFLLLKKVIDMERFHDLRVFLLTSLLSGIVIYLILVTFFGAGGPADYARPEGTNVFSQDEI